MATGAAQVIVPGFDSRTQFNVPFSYRRVVVHRPLAAHVFSHVRLSPATGKDSAVFDVTIADAHGQVLVTIEQFVMRQVSGAFGVALPLALPVAAQRPRQPETPAEAALRQGMTPPEGLDALDRILAVDLAPQIIASTGAARALARAPGGRRPARQCARQRPGWRRRPRFHPSRCQCDIRPAA